MLKSLYDYAIRNSLALPPGYVKKVIKAWILLYEDGSFQGIEMGSGEAVPVPDIGSQDRAKSYVLFERYSVLFSDLEEPEENEKKRTQQNNRILKKQMFLDTLRDAAEIYPSLNFCISVLSEEDSCRKLLKELENYGIKDGGALLSFRIDGISILSHPTLKEWWQKYRYQYLPPPKGKRSICFATGISTIPKMAQIATVDRLDKNGEKSTKRPILCGVNKEFPALSSYGFQQGEHAPISEDAASAVQSALNDLVTGSAVIAGTNCLHWYSNDIPKSEDPFAALFPDEDFEESPRSNEQQNIYEEQQSTYATRQLRSLEQGTSFHELDCTFYILLLARSDARVIIRYFGQGNYSDLKEHIDQWNRDLCLVNENGLFLLPALSLKERFGTLKKYQKSRGASGKDSKSRKKEASSDNDYSEISALSQSVLVAILSGGALPDAVAVRALNYIRSSMLSVGEDGNKTNGLFGKDACVWQWLKVWLLRKNGRSGSNLMSEYNPDYRGDAYHCGAQMALYEAIQNLADPSVNVTVAERYYASCIQTPALVLGRLSQLSQHHLAKVEDKYKGLAEVYREKLAAVNASMEAKAPTTLTLEQQSEFALGYYQMHALLSREKNARIAAKKEKESKN